MKKIISMGIASAVLALTAIAASADIKANGPETAKTGDVITVTITTTAEITDCGFIVSATGLEFVSVDTTTTDGSMIVNKAKEDGSYKIGGTAAAGKTIAANSVLATITFTVTGETGTKPVVEIKNAAGYEEAVQNLTVEVVAEEKPATSDSDSESTSESGSDSTSESGAGEGGSDVPGTGVALAVVPAVLAGAAVVVAKKRK